MPWLIWVIKCGDFIGGFGRALGEGAHLVGYHGKAATLLAGARRLDRGVKG